MNEISPRAPRPPHTCRVHPEGVATCYRRHGCRCRACTSACTAQVRHQRHYLRTGRPQRIDAGPAAAHLAALRLTMTPQQIAAASGVPQGTLKRVPRAAKIYRRTAAAILAVPIPKPIDSRNRHRVPAEPVRRRMHALAANGWSLRSLMAEMGSSHGASAWLNPARTSVEATTYRRVVELYDRLWNQPPREETPHQRKAATRARNLARTNGWARPLQWDEGHGPHGIDNPDATPYRAATETGIDLTEVKWLADAGESANAIAARLGYSDVKHLHRHLSRHHRLDLWQRITRRDAA